MSPQGVDYIFILETNHVSSKLHWVGLIQGVRRVVSEGSIQLHQLDDFPADCPHHPKHCHSRLRVARDTAGFPAYSQIFPTSLPTWVATSTTSPPSPGTPSAPPSLAGSASDFGCTRLGWCDGRCVQGPGTYSPQCADLRLLATPTSCRRVAACNPN
jgi:hypothetical protein